MFRLQRAVRVAGVTVNLIGTPLYNQTANTCSVCSAFIRKAQEQYLQQAQKQQQRVLLAPRRLLQQTNQFSPDKTQGTQDFDIGTHWGYTGKYGVTKWDKYFPSCKGSQQSPVDLISTDLRFDKELGPFTFINFDNTDDISWLLQNNGHSAQVTYTSGDVRVGGGSLGSDYSVLQFHFHWGSNDSIGSEHTINGVPYPMEMHVVTYNNNYENVGEASLFSDGLAVLGIFFEVSDNENANFSSLIKALKKIQNPGSDFSMSPVALTDLLPANRDKYYRYPGSLTTPPCSEVVTWTLFNQTVPISSEQLSAFRSMKSSEKNKSGRNKPMVNNFRPVQPLNDRLVKCNF